MSYDKMEADKFIHCISIINFAFMRDTAKSFDDLISSAKNKIGIAHKFANFVTKKAWSNDWSIDEYDIDTKAYFLGAKAYEMEIADKLRDLVSKGELKGFPLEKYTG
jgi:hypothetical protein